LPLCQRWLPRGQRKGDWWVASTPWREDKNPSLGVNLQSGNWKDFANPSVRGDIVALYAKVAGVGMVDAAKAVAIYVGHEYAQQQEPKDGPR
jgi:hypothetical protein